MSLHQRVDVCVIFLKFLHNGRQTSHQPLVLLYITEPNLKLPVTLKFRRRLVSYSKRKPFPAGSTNHAEIELNLFKIFVAATLRPPRREGCSTSYKDTLVFVFGSRIAKYSDFLNLFHRSSRVKAQKCVQKPTG